MNMPGFTGNNSLSRGAAIVPQALNLDGYCLRLPNSMEPKFHCDRTCLLQWWNQHNHGGSGIWGDEAGEGIRICCW